MLSEPLPGPTLELVQHKDNRFPSWNMEYYMLLIHRFGVVHEKANSIDTHNLSMHWKQDARMVNQGRTYYHKETDTFYMKTAKDVAFKNMDGSYSSDTIHLDVERKIIDSDYTKLAFSVGPPPSDIDNNKIVPCEVHRRENRIETFFTILDSVKDTQPTLEIGAKEDCWVFDITNRMEQFLSYRIKFWCGTACTKSKFSDKKDNLTFNVTLRGDNVKDIRIYTSFNAQQNPGRGAHVVNPGKPTLPSKVISIDMPSYSWQAIDGRNLQANPTASKDRKPQNPITFTDMGSKIRMELELPRNFAQILGATQASHELEALQRDIAYTVQHRIKDAFLRKTLANEELLRNNSMMQNINMGLRQSLAQTKRNLQFVCHENDKANDRLSKEMTLRRNCPTCIQMINKNTAEKNDEVIVITNQ